MRVWPLSKKNSLHENNKELTEKKHYFDEANLHFLYLPQHSHIFHAKCSNINTDNVSEMFSVIETNKKENSSDTQFH